jgi:hypothetical protein
MTNTLEVMSWIAGIAAVPTAVVLAFVGRSRSAKQTTSKSIAGEGATAISGDVGRRGRDRCRAQQPRER